MSHDCSRCKMLAEQVDLLTRDLKYAFHQIGELSIKNHRLRVTLGLETDETVEKQEKEATPAERTSGD